VRTADRLNLLLPWLNQPPEECSIREARHRLRQFINSFDGAPEAGCVRAEVVRIGTFVRSETDVPPAVRGLLDVQMRLFDVMRMHLEQITKYASLNDAPRLAEAKRDHKTTVERYERVKSQLQRLWANSAAESDSDIVTEHTSEEEELETLHWALNDLLRRGFPKERHHAAPQHDGVIAPQLFFQIKRVASTRPESHERKRLEILPGAYEMQVSGTRADLVPFLVMTLLTLPGAVVLARCPIRKAHSEELCGRWLVTTTGGAPRKYCLQCSGPDSGSSERKRYSERPELKKTRSKR